VQFGTPKKGKKAIAIASRISDISCAVDPMVRQEEKKLKM